MMDRTPRPQDISWFLDLRRLNQLDLDPPYQRKSVWTRGDKQYFLDTIFHNYPCPAVFLHKTISDEGETKYYVVDGKQRLQTIFDFVDGQISIPKDFGNSLLAGKKWGKLDADAKRTFWNYLITVEMLPSVDDAIVNSVFERINRNARKLTAQELRHAKYDGWLISVAEAEAEKYEWREFGIVTATRAKRMSDVQFISELVILIIKKEIIGFDQDTIDRFYADYDAPTEGAPDFVEEEFVEEFEGVKRYLSNMNEVNSCVKRYAKTLAHFYSLWSYVTLSGQGRSANDMAEKYALFMEKVTKELEGRELDYSDDIDAVRLYASNMRGAITDSTPRRERHKALKLALDD